MVPTEPPESSARAALTRHDAEGTCIAASPTSRAVLGRGPEALVGLLLPVLAHPEDADAITEAIAQLAGGWPDPIVLPCRLSLGGGRYRRLEVAFHALPGAAPEIAALWRPAAPAVEYEQGEKNALTEHVRRLKRRLGSVIESIPGVVWEAWRKEDPRLHRTDFVSDYVEAMTGYTADEWVRRPSFWETMIGRAPLPLPEAPDLPPDGPDIRRLRWTTKDGRTLWVESFVQPIWDTNGALLGARGVSLDVTARKEAEDERKRAEDERKRAEDERKRAEDEQARLREEVLLTQQRLVDQLSSPLIPITERALVMPLIGEIAGHRGDSIVEALLRGIADRRAEVAILDITGVPTVDPGAAHSLVRAAMGARLLGARVILTGLRPEVARYLVGADVDLAGITTCGTLQDGIRIALGPSSPKLVPGPSLHDVRRNQG